MPARRTPGARGQGSATSKPTSPSPSMSSRNARVRCCCPRRISATRSRPVTRSEPGRHRHSGRISGPKKRWASSRSPMPSLPSRPRSASRTCESRFRNGSRRYRASAKTTSLKPSALSLGCEWTMALCCRWTVSSRMVRLAGRGLWRSTHTEAGVGTTTAMAGMLCRLAAAINGSLAALETFVASMTVKRRRAIRRSRSRCRTSTASPVASWSPASSLTAPRSASRERIWEAGQVLASVLLPAPDAPMRTTRHRSGSCG